VITDLEPYSLAAGGRLRQKLLPTEVFELIGVGLSVAPRASLTTLRWRVPFRCWAGFDSYLTLPLTPLIISMVPQSIASLPLVRLFLALCEASFSPRFQAHDNCPGRHGTLGPYRMRLSLKKP
jgi:hypothetical protein